MSTEEKQQAYKQLESCEKRLIQLMEEYEKLLDHRYELISKAVCSKLHSLHERKNLATSIRLLYSTYSYNCGMLNENCTKLILSLDGVMSFGDPNIRQQRKSMVIRVQKFQVFVERLFSRSKSLQAWFNKRVLESLDGVEGRPRIKKSQHKSKNDDCVVF